MLTSGQLQPHPHHPPHQPASSDLPLPAKQPRTDVLPQYQTPVQQYASYLKFVYTREKLPIYDKWPQVKSKKYINLALIEKEDITKPEADQFMRATIHGNIDDIKKSKRAADIDQVAQLPDGSQPKCILVEGAPGVGKSTFAWKLCRKWGKGKLLQQYQLVVLLKLRDKSVRVAKNISDLFRYHNHQIQQAAVEEIQRTGGKGVLLLFEGYDELPEKLRTESSVFLDVITGEELPEATVLITSRPWASEFLHQEYKGRISQHIEILGFTKANIQSYLKTTAANDPPLLADLKKYISCYPHINSMMYIPLNSAIVVEVYRNSRKDDTLVPKTMTELYSSLVRSLLLRHLLDHPVHGKKRRWRVRSFSDLPQDVYQQLCELGRIAYEGIVHDQQVIFCDLPENFETLGLMQCAPELYADEGAAVSYNFLHLTVQEYLAGFHLSHQPVEKQIAKYDQAKREEQMRRSKQQQQRHHFHMVLQFLSGLKKFKEYSNEQMKTFVRDYSVTFDTLHWSFEAHDSKVIARALRSSHIGLIKQYNPVTPFDCFVLGYCVSHSNCNWKINLKHCNIGDEGVEMLVRGAVEEETHCTGGISEIYLRGNDITSEGVKHLLSFLIEVCRTLSELPSSSSTSLWKLYIGGNDLPPEAVELIISGLHHHTTLGNLDMSDSHFSLQNTISLASVLRTNHTLFYLNLWKCDIDSDGACQLASGLCTNDTLQELLMGGNLIDVKGATAFAEMLLKNKSMKALSFRDNSIGEEGTQKLIDSLAHNTRMETLSLPKKYELSVTSTGVERRVLFC